MLQRRGRNYGATASASGGARGDHGGGDGSSSSARGAEGEGVRDWGAGSAARGAGGYTTPIPGVLGLLSTPALEADTKRRTGVGEGAADTTNAASPRRTGSAQTNGRDGVGRAVDTINATRPCRTAGAHRIGGVVEADTTNAARPRRTTGAAPRPPPEGILIAARGTGWMLKTRPAAAAAGGAAAAAGGGEGTAAARATWEEGTAAAVLSTTIAFMVAVDTAGSTAAARP